MRVVAAALFVLCAECRVASADPRADADASAAIEVATDGGAREAELSMTPSPHRVGFLLAATLDDRSEATFC
jgi:hypothetical protein